MNVDQLLLQSFPFSCGSDRGLFELVRQKSLHLTANLINGENRKGLVGPAVAKPFT